MDTHAALLDHVHVLLFLDGVVLGGRGRHQQMLNQSPERNPEIKPRSRRENKKQDALVLLHLIDLLLLLPQGFVLLPRRRRRLVGPILLPGGALFFHLDLFGVDQVGVPLFDLVNGLLKFVAGVRPNLVELQPLLFELDDVAEQILLLRQQL